MSSLEKRPPLSLQKFSASSSESPVSRRPSVGEAEEDGVMVAWISYVPDTSVCWYGGEMLPARVLLPPVSMGRGSAQAVVGGGLG